MARKVEFSGLHLEALRNISTKLLNKEAIVLNPLDESIIKEILEIVKQTEGAPEKEDGTRFIAMCSTCKWSAEYKDLNSAKESAESHEADNPGHYISGWQRMSDGGLFGGLFHVGRLS